MIGFRQKPSLILKRLKPLISCSLAAGAFFSAMAHMDAGISTMNFESQAHSTFSTSLGWSLSVIQNYQEQGVIVITGTSNSSGNSFIVYPPSETARYTGSKAVEPIMFNNTATMSITRRGGRPFDLRSLKLFPRLSGTPSQVTLTGIKTSGPANNFIATSSTNLSGALIDLSLNTNFQNVVEVQIRLNAATSFARFQIDDIVIYEYPAITAQGVTVTESAGEAFVNVSVESPDSNIILNYQIIPDTATQPADYTLPNGSTTGQLTIPLNTGAAQLRIPIVNDTTTEALERFNVTFSGNPSGSTFIGSSTAVVKIANDDVSNYNSWVIGHGLAGPDIEADADPNGDGISNIESWLFRINPAGPSPQAWLARRASYLETAGNTPALRITIPSPLPSDVRLIFEEGTTLLTWNEQTRRSGFATGSAWTGVGASRVSESNTSTARTVTFPSSQNRGSRPAAFMRMKYELISTGGAG